MGNEGKVHNSFTKSITITITVRM